MADTFKDSVQAIVHIYCCYIAIPKWRTSAQSLQLSAHFPFPLPFHIWTAPLVSVASLAVSLQKTFCGYLRPWDHLPLTPILDLYSKAWSKTESFMTSTAKLLWEWAQLHSSALGSWVFRDDGLWWLSLLKNSFFLYPNENPIWSC